MDERLHSEEKVLLAIEMSNTQWRLRFASSQDVQRRRERSVVAGDVEGLGLELHKAREKFGLPGAQVVCCYEAGRDGFWLYRWLMGQGVACLVVESSSIHQDRRWKQVKTDGVDAEKLLEQLIDLQVHGKRSALRVVRVPSEQVEGMQRQVRERERLVKEQTGHRARIRSLLALRGLRVRQVTRAQCESARDCQGQALSAEVREEVFRELERLELVQQQTAAVERNLGEAVKDPQMPLNAIATMLAALKGIGSTGAHTLAREVFWRRFKNRREVGAYVGLTGCPYQSGDSNREQGVSKAGNKRARRVLVELAWQWLRFQPGSGLSRWFLEKTAGGAKRARRVYVVALARKLVVALWKWLAFGELPQGALIKPRVLQALA